MAKSEPKRILGFGEWQAIDCFCWPWEEQAKFDLVEGLVCDWHWFRALVVKVC